MKTNHNRIGGIVVAACAVLAGGSARAQPALQFTTVDVNYVYAASLGFGGYAIGGLTANVYTLPLSTSWQNVPFDGWTLKFLLPVQLGLYEFKAAFQGHDISLSQQSVTAVPGAELQIPVSSRFVVKPFVQGGAGHSFGTGGGNPDAWVYLTGVRSVAQWDAGGYTFSLGNGVIFAGDASVGPGFGEHYLTLQIAGEVRRPLGLRIGGFAPDLGVYAAEYYRHRLRRRIDRLSHQFRLPVLKRGRVGLALLDSPNFTARRPQGSPAASPAPEPTLSGAGRAAWRQGRRVHNDR